MVSVADQLLIDVFMKGRWDHHAIAGSQYVIPEELEDKIVAYLLEHKLVGVKQETEE